MYPTYSRAPSGLDPKIRSATAAAHPVAVPREPEPPGLTPDEIRRIVLDIIG